MALAEHARPRARLVPLWDRLRTLPERFRTDVADGFAADFGLAIGDDDFRVTIADGVCTVVPEPARYPSARIGTDPETWLALDEGSLSSIDAFLDDRISVRGNIDLAVRMQSLFHPSARPRSADDLEHVTIDVAGMDLSCFVFGDGPPVVLLHGLAATKLSYLPLLPALARRYRVIVPDLPGHGESSKPRAPYTPGYFADVVSALLDRLGLRRAALVGNSMGGRIALEVAATAPERVSALVLLGPAAAGLPFPFYARLVSVVPTGVGAVPLPMRKRVVAMAIRQLFADPDRLPRAAYVAGAEEFVRIYRAAPARVALLGAVRGLVADDESAFWSRAEDIEVPTLIVWGTEDRLVPVRLGRRLAATMPEARLVELPGVGHVPQFEVPRRTRRLALRFLEGVA